jgi:hypothetical protein
MCLVYAEPSAFQTLSAADRAALDRDSLEYDKDLEARGHYIHAAVLQSVSAAKTLRRRAGQVTTTDGPFAETKEVLCGFILIEAADQEQALKIAADIPMARVGSIEVRAELDFG